MPPQAPKYITHPVAIQKSDIALYRGFEGKANSTSLLLDKSKHGAGSLRFVTFAGALDLSDNLYHGVYQFLPNSEELATADLNQLPGLKPKKPEPTHAD